MERIEEPKIAEEKANANKESDNSLNVQKQSNASDCGLFAIAFATALFHGQVPEEMFFDVTALRQHLHDCIDKDQMEPFPASKRKCKK